MKSPTNVLESSSLAMTIDLLQKSDSITVLPERIARHHQRQREVVRLPIALTDCHVEFVILTRREQPLSPAATEFVVLLRRYGDSSVDDVRVGTPMHAAAAAGA